MFDLVQVSVRPDLPGSSISVTRSAVTTCSLECPLRKGRHTVLNTLVDSTSEVIEV